MVFNNISVLSCRSVLYISGGIRIKPTTCCKWLSNFIT